VIADNEVWKKEIDRLIGGARKKEIAIQAIPVI